MTEKFELGNENLMETESEKESVVIVDDAESNDQVNVETCVDEEIVADENPQETETEAVEGDTADQSTDTNEEESSADENPTEADSADENPDDDGTTDQNLDEQDANNDDVKDNDTDEGNLSKKEKIILLVIGIILILLLILLGIWGFNKTNRGLDLRELNSSENSSLSQTGDNNDEDTDDYYLYGHEVSSDKGISSDNSGDTTIKPIKQSSSSDSKPSSDNGSTVSDISNNSQDTDTSSNENNPDTDNNDTNSENNGSDDNNGNGNNTNTDKDKETDENNNTAPDYTGETKICITKINDDTGVITITVDGEKISVPVQTTVFNGRVTKSGVAQGKIFGFECGATVMIYYPQSEGMGTTEFTGYMSRTNDSLTILVDINGEKSKILIKINGFKSLK